MTNLDSIVRDLTSIPPRPKSEVRRLLQDLIKEAVKDKDEEWRKHFVEMELRYVRELDMQAKQFTKGK